MKSTFITSVVSFIKYNNTSFDDLAEGTGINVNTIRTWITKDSLPRADDAWKIAKYFGTSVEYLLGVDKKEIGTKELPEEFMNAMSVINKYTDS